MTVAVVVVAPSATIERAMAWGRLGLVADSLWASSDELTNIDPDAPNAVLATRIAFDREPVKRPLARQLAELGSLDEARITWLRKTDATNEALLQALDDLLRNVLPHDQMHWLDIAVPLRRTDEAVAPLAGKWVQFRIHPSDRPAPDVSDAGWDLGLEVPLHVTLVLTGILGGLVSPIPWAQLDASKNWVVRVFTRLVDGGLDATREARRFLLDTLPTSHAAELHGDGFLAATPAEAAELVKRAADWLMAADDRALTYKPPEPSRFSDHPRLTVGQRLLSFRRFLPTGIMALFGLEPEPTVGVGHVLEFSDLGYNRGKPVKVVAPTSGIPDYSALEAQALVEAGRSIAALRGQEGDHPPAATWESMAQIACSLVDGGGAQPVGWEPATRAKRRLSVAPSWVQLSPPELAAHEVPELALAESPAVIAAAIREAGREAPPPLGNRSDGTSVTATAARLTGSGNKADAADLAAQLSSLGDVPSVAGSPSLLDQVHGRVLGGLIRSRLDAERWTTRAATAPEGAVPRWQKDSGRFRWIWWIVNAIFGVLWLVWIIFNDQINAALGRTLDVTLGLVLIGIAQLLVLLLLLYLFFVGWSTFMEQGRRRLELIGLWHNSAAQAWVANASLVNTELTTRAWVGILSRILVPVDHIEDSVGAFDPESAPMSMQVGHPQFKPVQMKGWLADVGAQPGWRLACLSQIAAKFLACPADRSLARLAQDPALPGGPLERFAREQPELTEAWCRTRADEIRCGVGDRIAENANNLHVPGLSQHDWQLKQFLHAITPSDDEGPWQHDYIVDAKTGEAKTTPELVVSPTLSTGRFRVQVEPLDVASDYIDGTSRRMSDEDDDLIR